MGTREPVLLSDSLQTTGADQACQGEVRTDFDRDGEANGNRALSLWAPTSAPVLLALLRIDGAFDTSRPSLLPLSPLPLMALALFIAHKIPTRVWTLLGLCGLDPDLSNK